MFITTDVLSVGIGAGLDDPLGCVRVANFCRLDERVTAAVIMVEDESSFLRGGIFLLGMSANHKHRIEKTKTSQPPMTTSLDA